MMKPLAGQPTAPESKPGSKAKDKQLIQPDLRTVFADDASKLENGQLARYCGHNTIFSEIN